MFYHFFTNGKIEAISSEEARKRMDNISSQWETETHSVGTLYIGVFDWAYENHTILIPKLSTGGFVPENTNAHSLVGGEKIYGDCFLKTDKPIDFKGIFGAENIINADKADLETTEPVVKSVSYQQRLGELAAIIEKKGKVAMEMDKRISQINGFGDVGEMELYKKSQIELSDAINEFNNLHERFKKEGAKFNDIIK